MTHVPAIAAQELYRPRERVVAWIREGIQSQRLIPGMPLPSERVIAQQLKVSRATVRAALSELRMDGFFHVGDGGRRRLASNERSSNRLMNRVVAVLSEAPLPPGPIDATQEQLYTKSLVAASIEALGLYALGLAANQLRGADLKNLAQDPPRGVLVVDDPLMHRMLPEVIASLPSSVPVVARVWSDTDFGSELRVDRILSDHAEGTATLTRWLAERGRKQILRLWQTNTPGVGWIQARNRGYERAVAELGLPALPPLVLPPACLSEVPPQFASRQEAEFHVRARTIAGYLAEQFRAGPVPDAVMVLTDEHAYEVSAALRLLGRQPNSEMLIVGYDNHVGRVLGARFEANGPAATMDKNTHASARMMVELLEDRLAGRLPVGPQICRCSHRLVENAGR